MADPAGSPPRERWEAPAKINLWLEVLGRRPDGLHDVDVGYQAIDLVDTVALEPASGEPAVTCRVAGPFAEGVPAGEANLASRAARLLAERTGHDPRVAISIDKAIPAGAGLGGGSSDAAAVLLALGHRFAVPDPLATLRPLAAELGADVPFFLAGGTAVGRGTGAELAPADPPAERWGILVWPGVGVSSAWAYGAWDAAAEGDAGEPAADRPVRSGRPTARDWAARRNDLEAVVFARHPEVRAARDLLAEGPAIGARMTGSGGAAFALYRSEADRDADLDRVRAGARAWPGGRAWPFACRETGVRRVG